MLYMYYLPLQLDSLGEHRDDTRHATSHDTARPPLAADPALAGHRGARRPAGHVCLVVVLARDVGLEHRVGSDLVRPDRLDARRSLRPLPLCPGSGGHAWTAPGR